MKMNKYFLVRVMFAAVAMMTAISAQAQIQTTGTPGSPGATTTIDGKQVGQASAAGIPGGPIESVRFLLGHLAQRRRPLRAGDWVSTGAITGVHRVFPGQHASGELIGGERIDVSIAPARARDA